jgi:hypothetical protein
MSTNLEESERELLDVPYRSPPQPRQSGETIKMSVTISGSEQLPFEDKCRTLRLHQAARRTRAPTTLRDNGAINIQARTGSRAGDKEKKKRFSFYKCLAQSFQGSTLQHENATLCRALIDMGLCACSQLLSMLQSSYSALLDVRKIYCSVLMNA